MLIQGTLNLAEYLLAIQSHDLYRSVNKYLMIEAQGIINVVRCRDHNQNATHVCIEPDCQRESLFCLVCLFIDHERHQTYSIEGMSDEFDKLRHFQPPVVETKRAVNGIREHCSALITGLRKTIDAHLTKIESSLQDYFEHTLSTIDRISAADHIQLPRFKIKGHQFKTVSKQVFSQIRKYKKKYRIQQQIKDKYHRITSEFAKIAEQFINLQGHVVNHLLPIEQMLAERNQHKTNLLHDLRWSARLKHNQIKILLATATRIGQRFSTFFDFCLAEKVMSSHSNQVYKWSLKINNESLRFGMVLEQITSTNNFQFDYSIIRQGLYLVGVHDILLAQNRSTKKTSKGKKNIDLEYDSIKKLLIVSQQQHEERLELNIRVEGNYRPCVFFSRPDSRATLLN